MLSILGWVLIGVAACAALAYFWDGIASWLNSTAADAVEAVLGYNARRNMQRAIVRISNLRNTLLQNVTTIYTKRNAMDSHYDKVTYDTTAPVYQIDQAVLDEIKKEGKLTQTFQYNS